MKVSTFFKTDYVDYSSYDNLRKIGSAVDGMKNTARKIINTVIDKKIVNELKVSQLNSKMAEHTEYLHGDASGVVVTMAQAHAGTNNLPLLDRGGNFGTRSIPEASAPRYIYTNGSKEMWELFNKDDNNILIKQSFEGEDIEPMFYLPSLPMLLCNGSEGISSGFAQKILPRDPKAIKKYLKYTLEGKNKQNRPFKNIPYWNGFNGLIEQGENPNQWLIKGVVKRLNTSTVEITELPIGYNLKSYLKVLKTLRDNGDIVSFQDNSDGENIFNFTIKFTRTILTKLSDERLLEKLKLVKKITENYTAMTATNTVHTFIDVNEIFQYYISIKKEYMLKRKNYLMTKLVEDIHFDASKYIFIKMIVDDELKINKRKKDTIIKDLDKIPKILKRDESYDYLLNMPIASLTIERMKKLMDDIKAKKQQLDKLKKMTIEDMWLEDLS